MLVEMTVQQYLHALQGGGGGGGGDGYNSSAAPSMFHLGTPRSSAKVPEKLVHLLQAKCSEVAQQMEEVVNERMRGMETLSVGEEVMKEIWIGRSVWRGKEEESTGSSPYQALEKLEESGGQLEVVAKLKGECSRGS